MNLIKAIDVLKSVGINVSKLPKLAKTKRFSEAILFGSKSAYRALLHCYTDAIAKSDDLIGASPTVASASVGALLACTKSDKQALYLTLCAIGLSDHPESLVKTIHGNATKWNRTDAYNRYKSDLALVAVLEANPDILKYITDTYEAIHKQLAAISQSEAKAKRDAK